MNKKYTIIGFENLKFNTRDEADNYADEKLLLKSYMVKNNISGQEWEYEITKNNYKYRLTSTDGNYLKYGSCKVCNSKSIETFIQVESELIEEDGERYYTHYKCKDLFGCKQCLINSRR